MACDVNVNPRRTLSSNVSNINTAYKGSLYTNLYKYHIYNV